MVLGRADVCVVGAGAAGCVLAARLSGRGDRSVCLVEAGPDYGHHDDGRWPADLLDASDCATSHDWGYGTDVACRAVGGCSAHNGCLVVWGTPGDYDEWAAATGDPAWGWAGMAPLLARAEAAIATRGFAQDEVGAFTRAALAGWESLGETVLHDFNLPAATRGAGLVPVNRRGRTRWSAALAYLDPARGRQGLTIVPGALADRVVVEGGRARAVAVQTAEGPGLIAADTIVLAAGAYGSPAILLRSGIGPARELRELGIDVVADVAGVGRNLVDHPAVHVRLSPSDDLAAQLAADDERGILTHVQSKLKAASSRCADGTFDLHALPNVGWETDATGLVCANRGDAYPLEARFACDRCFGPVEPGYDNGAIRREVTRERIEQGPRTLWRYADLLPVRPVAGALPVGCTPLIPVPRLAAALGLRELYIKVEGANPTHITGDGLKTPDAALSHVNPISIEADIDAVDAALEPLAVR